MHGALKHFAHGQYDTYFNGRNDTFQGIQHGGWSSKPNPLEDFRTPPPKKSQVLSQSTTRVYLPTIHRWTAHWLHSCRQEMADKTQNTDRQYAILRRSSLVPLASQWSNTLYLFGVDTSCFLFSAKDESFSPMRALKTVSGWLITFIPKAAFQFCWKFTLFSLLLYLLIARGNLGV